MNSPHIDIAIESVYSPHPNTKSITQKYWCSKISPPTHINLSTNLLIKYIN